MLAANACQSRSPVLACHGQAKHQTCNLFPILFCGPSLKRQTFAQLLAQPTAPWPVGSLEVRKLKFWEVRSPEHPGIWNTKIHNMNIPDFLIQICVTDDGSSQQTISHYNNFLHLAQVTDDQVIVNNPVGEDQQYDDQSSCIPNCIFSGFTMWSNALPPFCLNYFWTIEMIDSDIWIQIYQPKPKAIFLRSESSSIGTTQREF